MQGFGSGSLEEVWIWIDKVISAYTVIASYISKLPSHLPALSGKSGNTRPSNPRLGEEGDRKVVKERKSSALKN